MKKLGRWPQPERLRLLLEETTLLFGYFFQQAVEEATTSDFGKLVTSPDVVAVPPSSRLTAHNQAQSRRSANADFSHDSFAPIIALPARSSESEGGPS